MTFLELKGISLYYQGVPTLENVSLGLAEGRILCLLGPSGCGKTSLLRIIAGLETPDKGSVRCDGRDMTNVPPHKRSFGMMFQEFALFPHKNVFDNIAFGLEMQNTSPGGVAMRVDEMLNLVGLSGFGKRNVGELSGGERQRVALARSLCPQPRLLMLDEPMGALDRTLRERLMLDIRRILKKVGTTAIFVTHDQSEAFAIADDIAVINSGRLEHYGQPEEIYTNPATAFVADFLGHNILTGSANGKIIESPFGIIHLASPIKGTAETEVRVIIRPEAVRLVEKDGACPAGHTVISGRVSDRLFQGGFYRLGVEAEGQMLFFEIPVETPPPGTGEQVYLALPPAAVVFLKDKNGV